jgi:pyruvate dehydrogenase E1 component alpha subunit
MHLADVRLNFWGGHAIVGAHLPLAAGMALADHYQGREAATICFFGDGATNIGYFHEALNLAAVWKLPVLWVCENNQYGMGTAVERASAVGEIRQKAEAYGIPGARVNGMDVLEVRAAAEQALEHARREGPFLLEAITYRYRGHSMGDPERYRRSEEVRKWQEEDPIGILHKHILEQKAGSADDLERRDVGDAFDRSGGDSGEVGPGIHRGRGVGRRGCRSRGSVRRRGRLFGAGVARGRHASGHDQSGGEAGDNERQRE